MILVLCMMRLVGAGAFHVPRGYRAREANLAQRVPDSRSFHCSVARFHVRAMCCGKSGAPGTAIAPGWTAPARRNPMLWLLLSTPLLLISAAGVIVAVNSVRFQR